MSETATKETEMTAAELFTSTAAKIVTQTGCTVEAAVDYLTRQMLAERPELLAKVVLTSGMEV